MSEKNLQTAESGTDKTDKTHTAKPLTLQQAAGIACVSPDIVPDGANDQPKLLVPQQ